MSSLSVSCSLTIIYLSIDIILVYMKVVMHQGCVLSPLLFGVVMDVFHSEAKSGIPSELLYTDDLVLMVMVESSDGNIIVNSGKSPCGKVVQCRASAHYVKGGFTSSIVVCVVTCRW